MAGADTTPDHRWQPAARALRRDAAPRPHLPHRRGRVLRQALDRADRAAHQFAAAIGAAAREHALSAGRAKGAFVGADAGIAAIGRQIGAATFAARAQFEHGGEASHSVDRSRRSFRAVAQGSRAAKRGATQWRRGRQPRLATSVLEGLRSPVGRERSVPRLGLGCGVGPTTARAAERSRAPAGAAGGVLVDGGTRPPPARWVACECRAATTVAAHDAPWAAPSMERSVAPASSRHAGRLLSASLGPSSPGAP